MFNYKLMHTYELRLKEKALQIETGEVFQSLEIL